MTNSAHVRLPLLAYQRACELFSYDPETGILSWRIARPGLCAGAVAGTVTSDGYIQVEADGRFYRAHRVAFLLVTGQWPTHHVDHRNGLRHDNRWLNLREATPLQNARNRRPAGNGISGRTGVYPLRGGKWLASIGDDSREIHLGRFATKDEAISVRVAAEWVCFGEFAPQPVEVRS